MIKVFAWIGLIAWIALRIAFGIGLAGIIDTERRSVELILLGVSIIELLFHILVIVSPV